nr:hypothetical protein [uncultured Gellertiella sp.]
MLKASTCGILLPGIRFHAIEWVPISDPWYYCHSSTRLRCRHNRNGRSPDPLLLGLAAGELGDILEAVLFLESVRFILNQPDSGSHCCRLSFRENRIPLFPDKLYIALMIASTLICYIDDPRKLSGR